MTGIDFTSVPTGEVPAEAGAGADDAGLGVEDDAVDGLFSNGVPMAGRVGVDVVPAGLVLGVAGRFAAFGWLLVFNGGRLGEFAAGLEVLLIAGLAAVPGFEVGDLLPAAVSFAGSANEIGFWRSPRNMK